MIALHILPGSCITSCKMLPLLLIGKDTVVTGQVVTETGYLCASLIHAGSSIRTYPNTVTKDTCDEGRLQYGVLVGCIHACI